MEKSRSGNTQASLLKSRTDIGSVTMGTPPPQALKNNPMEIENINQEKVRIFQVLQRDFDVEYDLTTEGVARIEAILFPSISSRLNYIVPADSIATAGIIYFDPL